MKRYSMSVVMRVFNAEKHLREALATVAHSLAALFFGAMLIYAEVVGNVATDGGPSKTKLRQPSPHALT